jgi:formylglycine-generating enzyme
MFRTLVVATLSLLVSACSFSCEMSSKPAVDASSPLLLSAAVPVEEVVVRGPCPSGMQNVKGDYCPQVEQTCVEWADADKSPTANSGIGPLRCKEFAPSKCTAKKREPLNFCMDTYEWPNKKGELPPIGGTWREAKASCESIGKRLCTAQEWTFACEGEDVKPYPYGDGLHRDDTACNIDKPSMDPSTPRSEWHKHYSAVPSGSMDKCVSWAGVHDMTGNVDEWVHNVGGRPDGDPYYSGLKGGYWGPVRTRCRPMTTVHGPDFSFYQIGFRCCRDAAR